MNILFVGAHHDDLEVACGASVRRLVEDGHRVVSAILTTSTWTGPDGSSFRSPAAIETYCRRAAEVLGYKQINLGYCPCFELAYADAKVVDLLNIMREHAVDTLVTLWTHDAHKDHRAVSEIALAASRNLPRVLTTRLSWNSSYDGFTPRLFVEVQASHLEAQERAMRCYEDEFGRTGERWLRFMRSRAELYGLEAGCRYAQGFEVLKYRY